MIVGPSAGSHIVRRLHGIVYQASRKPTATVI